MIDLLHLLHVGDKLYSPICGECKVIALDSEEIYCITVQTPYKGRFDFDRYGRFALNGEVLLFII